MTTAEDMTQWWHDCHTSMKTWVGVPRTHLSLAAVVYIWKAGTWTTGWEIGTGESPRLLYATSDGWKARTKTRGFHLTIHAQGHTCTYTHTLIMLRHHTLFKRKKKFNNVWAVTINFLVSNEYAECLQHSKPHDYGKKMQKSKQAVCPLVSCSMVDRLQDTGDIVPSGGLAWWCLVTGDKVSWMAAQE